MPIVRAPGGGKNEAAEILNSISAEWISSWYKSGDITTGEKNDWLRAKGHQEIRDAITKNGTVWAYWEQVVKSSSSGWSKILKSKELASESELTVKGQLWQSLRSIYGAMQIVFAPFSAFDVFGEKAEEMALDMGATPGQARIINIITAHSVDIIPIGTVARSGARVIQGARPAAKEGAKLSEDVVKMLNTVEKEEVTAVRAVTEALELDGVKDAGSVVLNSIKAADPELATIAERIIVDPAKASKVLSEASKVVVEFTPFLESAAKHTKRITADEATKALPDLMKKFGADPQMLQLPSGVQRREALTDRQLYGYLKAMEDHATNLGALAREALTGEPAAQHAFARYVSDLLTPSTDKVVVNQAFKDLMMYWDPENMARGRYIDAIKSFAESMAVLKDEQLAKFAFTSQQGFINFGAVVNSPRLKELYANILLPLAGNAAALGNSISVQVHLLETAAGAVFSADRATGLTMRDSIFAMQGMKNAWRDSAWAAGQTFLEKNPLSGVGRYPQFAAWPGMPGRVIRAPGDAMMAIDDFFNTLLYRASLYEQLGAEAIHHGMSFAQAGKWIELHMTNPNLISLKMHETAQQLSLNGTYQNHLSKAGEHLSEFLRETPWFFYFPFIKSFWNLTKYSWNRTPILQLFSKSLYNDIKAGGRRADMAIGRLTISNFFGMYLYEMAKEDFITGSGPVRKELRPAWEATHTPHSIRTPFGVMSYKNMEPLTQVLGMVSDMAAMSDQLDEEDFQQLAMGVIYSIAHNFVDTGGFHQVMRLTDALDGITEGRIKGAARDAVLAPFTTLVTGGPLMQRTKTILDPVNRDTTNYMDSLKARVPGMSTSVPPVRWQLPYGDIKIPPLTTPNWFGYFSPFAPKTRPESTDRIDMEGARLQVKGPRFSRNLGGNVMGEGFDARKALPGEKLGTTLSPEEFDHRLQVYNKLVRDGKEGLVPEVFEDDEYKTAPPARQKQMFENFLDLKWAESGFVIQQMNPAIEMRVRNSEIRGALPLLDPQDRPEYQQERASEPTLFDQLDDAEVQNLLKFGYIKPSEARLPLRQELELERVKE